MCSVILDEYTTFSPLHRPTTYDRCPPTDFVDCNNIPNGLPSPLNNKIEKLTALELNLQQSAGMTKAEVLNIVC